VSIVPSRHRKREEGASGNDGARKEVTMEIIGEYLKPLAEAADDSEENLLGLVTYRPDSTRPRPRLQS
jgi:hypothetical protein